jgi:hypothetical protein
MEAFLVSVAPSIRSLKMYLPDSKGLSPLQDTFSVYRDRFGHPLTSLDTLYLRVGPGTDHVGLMEAIGSECPALRELHLSTYTEKEMELVLGMRVCLEGGRRWPCMMVQKSGEEWRLIVRVLP